MSTSRGSFSTRANREPGPEMHTLSSAARKVHSGLVFCSRNTEKSVEEPTEPPSNHLTLIKRTSHLHLPYSEGVIRCLGSSSPRLNVPQSFSYRQLARQHSCDLRKCGVVSWNAGRSYHLDAGPSRLGHYLVISGVELTLVEENESSSYTIHGSQKNAYTV